MVRNTEKNEGRTQGTKVVGPKEIEEFLAPDAEVKK